MIQTRLLALAVSLALRPSHALIVKKEIRENDFLTASHRQSSLLRGTIADSARQLLSNQVVGLELYDATTNQLITNIADGDVIDLNDYDNVDLNELNLRAVTLAESDDTVTNDIASVQFLWDNSIYKTENGAPFALCGDTATNGYNACGSLIKLETEFTVTAAPYSGRYATGTAGTPLTVRFTLVDSNNAVSAPVPTSAPISSTSSSISSSPLFTLQLIYAPTDTVVMNLYDGAVVDLYALGLSAEFNIEAVAGSSAVTAVKFSNGMVEGGVPYSYCSDKAGDFYTCDDLGIGSHTVTAQAIGTGNTNLGSYAVTFEIVSTTNTAPVSAPSSPAPVSVVSSPTTGGWIEVDDMAPLHARLEACFIMVNRKAYLVGGRDINPVDIYDPVSRTWSTGAAPPIELHHTQCVVADDKIWLVSPWTGSYPQEISPEYAYVYDTATDEWSTRTALPASRRRGAAAAVLVGRRIYVSHGNIGGHETTDFTLPVTLGWLDYYDIDQDKWTTNLPDAPNPRDHTGGTLINGRICVGGGRDGGTVNWPTVGPTDCFDVAANEWSVEASIPVERAGSSYGTTCDGKLMVAGGEGPDCVYDEVHVFDGSTWTEVASLNQGRHGSGLAVDCTCKQITIASGSGGPKGGPKLYSVETYFSNGVDTQCTA